MNVRGHVNKNIKCHYIYQYPLRLWFSQSICLSEQRVFPSNCLLIVSSVTVGLHAGGGDWLAEEWLLTLSDQHNSRGSSGFEKKGIKKGKVKQIKILELLERMSIEWKWKPLANEAFVWSSVWCSVASRPSWLSNPRPACGKRPSLFEVLHLSVVFSSACYLSVIVVTWQLFSTPPPISIHFAVISSLWAPFFLLPVSRLMVRPICLCNPETPLSACILPSPLNV